MHDRLIVSASIFIVLFAIGYAGSTAVTAKPRQAHAAVIAPGDPIRRLATLEGRLAEAQQSIDEVLLLLANASVDSERDAQRVRLGVLYRLESGLSADIARVREQLQSLPAPRVDRAWQPLDSTNR